MTAISEANTASLLAKPGKYLTFLLGRESYGLSEITRNVVQHAGSPGEIQIGRIIDGTRVGLQIVVSDQGKGFENPARFLADGKLSALGAGLPGTAKLVDRFDIKSAAGMGTTVTMEFWK